MSRQQTVERERRWALPAALAAIAIVPLFIIASAADPQTGPVPITGLDTERYRAIDEHAGAVILAAGLRGLALAAMAIPLLYLFRAAQARSARVNAPMIGFAFIGPLLFAAQSLISAIAQTQVASDFVGRVGAGGDIYTLLDDLSDDSTLLQVGVSLLYPAILGLVVALVYIPLQAMRVGLLTRVFAILGMALGVLTLIVSPAFSLLALVLWFGWLGLLYLNRVPRGRPPAWAAGEAIPWPRAGEEVAQPAPAGVVEGDATEAFGSDEAAKDHSARRERARKRKRKRRQ